MIDAQTELYGVIGDPIRHSLSPLIHNGVFERLGRNAIYLAIEVKDIEDALRGVRGLGVRGVSVTIPFKTEVIPFLDKVEGLAKKIGAVNTIVNRGGKLIGYNTDCDGAVKALEEKINLRGKRVLVLGAGGAARAIGFGLKGRECQLVVSNRSEKKGEDLSRELKCHFLPMSSLFKMTAGELEADILINATSVGMYPRQRETPFPKRLFEEGMMVMDIVYQPLQTRLLREAKAKKCLTINGLEMLVRQGLAQLTIWTGRRLEIGQIRDELYKTLKKRNVGTSLKSL